MRVLPMSVVLGSRPSRVTEEEAPGASSAKGEGVARVRGGGFWGEATERERARGSEGAAPLLVRDTVKDCSFPGTAELESCSGEATT